MATHRISCGTWALLPDTSGNVWLEPAAITQTNDRYAQMVARFKDTATKDTLGFRFQVPQNYVGSAKFYVCWTSTTSDNTKNVVWTVDYSSASQTSSIDPSADEENLTVTAANTATSQTAVQASMTATASNFAAGDICQGKLGRNGTSGSDTLVADAVVYEFFFEYADA